MKKFFKNCLLGMSALTMALGFTACDEPENITYADTYNDKTVSTVYEEVSAEMDSIVNQETRNYQVNQVMRMSMAMKMLYDSDGDGFITEEDTPLETGKQSTTMNSIMQVYGDNAYTKSTQSGVTAEGWYIAPTMYMKTQAGGESVKYKMDMDLETFWGSNSDLTIYDVDPSVFENLQFAIGDKNGCRFTVTITGEYINPIIQESIAEMESQLQSTFKAMGMDMSFSYDNVECSDILYTIYVNTDGTFKKANMDFDMSMTITMSYNYSDGTQGTMSMLLDASYNTDMWISNAGKIAPITPPSDASSYSPSTYM